MGIYQRTIFGPSTLQDRLFLVRFWGPQFPKKEGSSDRMSTYHLISSHIISHLKVFKSDPNCRKWTIQRSNLFTGLGALQGFSQGCFTTAVNSLNLHHLKSSTCTYVYIYIYIYRSYARNQSIWKKICRIMYIVVYIYIHSHVCYILHVSISYTIVYCTTLAPLTRESHGASVHALAVEVFWNTHGDL